MSSLVHASFLSLGLSSRSASLCYVAKKQVGWFYLVYLKLLLNLPLALFGDAFAILHGLLTSIPTFWGSGEISQVISLRIDQFTYTGNATSTALSSLIKAISKRIPGKVLLPTLFDMWAATGSSGNLVCDDSWIFIDEDVKFYIVQGRGFLRSHCSGFATRGPPICA